MINAIDATTSALLAAAVRKFRDVGPSHARSGADRFASLPHSLAFVASDDDSITGYCWGYVLERPDRSSMVYVHDLHVDAAVRGRGLGRQLMSAMTEAATSSGASTMFLSTGADNAAARSLYASLGAVVAEQGPTVNYWWNLERS